MSGTKVAFITGGASGLGRALARRFAADGYRVLVGDLPKTSKDEVEEVLQELRGVSTVEDKEESIAFVPCDVRDPEHLVRARKVAIDRWDRVDVVVNNAGIGGGSKFIEDTVEELDWEPVMDVNVMGVVRGCQTFAPVFRRQNAGHFINIASAAGLFSAASMGPYSASKAAVISLSETLKYEFVTQPDIGVTVVCPGFFKTNIHKSMTKGKGSLPNSEAFIKKAMDKSKVSADDVAQQIRDAMRDKTFLVLPTPNERWAYYLKRFVPSFVDNMMSKFARKTIRAWEQVKASESPLS